MHRFFLSPQRIDGARVRLDGRVAHQLNRVLQVREGDEAVVLDGTGWEYRVVLDALSPAAVQGFIVERRQGCGEPRAHRILYQAVLKADGFETVLQKGTELGVREFVPVSLGRRILRAETAGPAAVAAIMYELGELGG